MEIYVVRPGDTLSEIARRFGVTLSELINLNRLPDPGQLVVGQAILIPRPSMEPFRYTVAPGDTLFQLAQLFGVTVAALVTANQIPDPNRLQVGTVLTIPGWSQIRYTVRPGDTLYQISIQYGIPLNLIVRVNQIIDPARIFPGQTLVIPQRVPSVDRKTIETMGYFQSTNLAGLTRSLELISPYITYAGFFQFPFVSDGTVSAPANTERAVSIFNTYNIRPLLLLTNWSSSGFDPDLARAVLGNPAIKAGMIDNLLQLIERFGFAGINSDLENMYPEDRQLHTDFISDLRKALRPRGYLVTLAAPAKAADFPDSPWVGTFDYRALGELADFIFLMAYEWGWSGGPPMAIAPITEVRRVLDYAVTQIPAGKILLGIPFYGYNWELPDTPENTAVPVNLVEVYSLAYRYNAIINYDPVAQAPWFRYTDQTGTGREVWFEDARSVSVKYDTAREYNLRGVGWWSFLNEPYGFPQNWPIMDERFIVRKS